MTFASSSFVPQGKGHQPLNVERSFRADSHSSAAKRYKARFPRNLLPQLTLDPQFSINVGSSCFHTIIISRRCPHHFHSSYICSSFIISGMSLRDRKLRMRYRTVASFAKHGFRYAGNIYWTIFTLYLKSAWNAWSQSLPPPLIPLDLMSSIYKFTPWPPSTRGHFTISHLITYQGGYRVSRN